MQAPIGEYHLNLSIRIYSDREGVVLFNGPAEEQEGPKTVHVERQTMILRFSENSESIRPATGGLPVLEAELFRVVVDADWIFTSCPRTEAEEVSAERLIKVYVKGYLAALHGEIGQSIFGKCIG